jgi:hypothetical protein
VDRAVLHIHRGMGARIATVRQADVTARAWMRNDVGSATVDIPQASQFATADYINGSNVYVITSMHQPPWVGYIAGDWEEDGQLLSIPLIELSGILSERATGAKETYQGSGGTAFEGALRTAHRRNPLPFQIPHVTDFSGYESWEFHNQWLLDVVRQAAEAANAIWWAEYTVTPYAVVASLWWGQRRGKDNSSRVTLQSGRNIANGIRLSGFGGGSLSTVTVTGKSGHDTVYQQRPTASLKAVTTPQGIAQAETVKVVEQLADDRTALQAAQSLLEQRESLGIRLAVTDPDLWPFCGIDDQIRVTLSPHWYLGRGLDTRARIVGVQPNDQNQLLELTLSIEDQTNVRPIGLSRPQGFLPSTPDLLATMDRTHPLAMINALQSRVNWLERRA